jgi:hypothetical protein
MYIQVTLHAARRSCTVDRVIFCFILLKGCKGNNVNFEMYSTVYLKAETNSSGKNRLLCTLQLDCAAPRVIKIELALSL